MALLHPSDHSSSVPGKETTRHPRICLLSGFAFIIGTALLVHLVFNALI